MTPAGHALARDFVTLDHFYADGEISVLGHSYTTSGYASPLLQWLGNAAYGNRFAGYPFGTAPALFSPAYLWDALDARGVDYRVYGEPYYASTAFWVDPVEELTAHFYTQLVPSSTYPIRTELRQLVYAALVD